MLPPIRSLDDGPEDEGVEQSQRNQWVWVQGFRNGQLWTTGPFYNEDDALSSSHDYTQVKTYTLPTRSLQRARQMIEDKKHGGASSDALRRTLPRDRPPEPESHADEEPPPHGDLPQRPNRTGNIFGL